MQPLVTIQRSLRPGKMCSALRLRICNMREATLLVPAGGLLRPNVAAALAEAVRRVALALEASPRRMRDAAPFAASKVDHQPILAQVGIGKPFADLS